MPAVLPRLFSKITRRTRLFAAYCNFTGAEPRALVGYGRRHVSIIDIDINSRHKHTG